MILAILADDDQKKELNSRRFPDGVELVYVDSVRSLGIIEADAYFDLEFENDVERNRKLAALLPRPVVVNSVTDTCAEIGHPFMRINAWPTMLSRDIVEVAVPDGLQPSAQTLFGKLQWQLQLVPDEPGLVTPRVISNVINEALFALNEGVSSEAEIDLAMKLGTNYPHGPFEWLQLLGPKRVYDLLTKLNSGNPRYTVAPMLNS